MTVISELAHEKGSGSFPLADLPELLELDNIDINLPSVSNGGIEELVNVPKVSPGHHRANLLLDGITCSGSGSSTGSSTHSTPSGSLDGTPAASDAIAVKTCTGVTCSTTGAAAVVLGTNSASTCRTDPAGNPMQNVLDPATQLTYPDMTANSNINLLGSQLAGLAVQQQHTDAAGALLQCNNSSAASMSSSSSSNDNINRSKGASNHAGPSTLQLPDFFTFALPEECAFTESMDDGLTTPTPHTPVVQSIFAGDGLPVSALLCAFGIPYSDTMPAALSPEASTTTWAFFKGNCEQV
jgi:hypothetical protein